jgi:hypothetical protein
MVPLEKKRDRGELDKLVNRALTVAQRPEDRTALKALLPAPESAVAPADQQPSTTEIN